GCPPNVSRWSKRRQELGCSRHEGWVGNHARRLTPVRRFGRGSLARFAAERSLALFGVELRYAWGVFRGTHALVGRIDDALGTVAPHCAARFRRRTEFGRASVCHFCK